jgi:hypothetical protein
MGALVGDSETFSTWGRFRTAVANQNVSLINTAHNIEFLSGFKADTGNGFLRFEPTLRFVFTYQPLVLIADLGGGDAFAFYAITEENEVQFLGQTVNATGGSFNITTDAFTSTLGQSVIGIASAPIIDVGLLTPF